MQRTELEDRVAKLESLVKDQQELLRALVAAFAGHQSALEAVAKHTGMTEEAVMRCKIESTLLH